MNAEREEEREINGIKAEGEMHRSEVSAIREKKTEIPCREREMKSQNQRGNKVKEGEDWER